MATSETLASDVAPAGIAPAPLFFCAFSDHAHDAVPNPSWGASGESDCCADLFADWDVPAPPAIAVAYFGPLGPRDICAPCLNEYLPAAVVVAPADSHVN